MPLACLDLMESKSWQSIAPNTQFLSLGTFWSSPFISGRCHPITPNRSLPGDLQFGGDRRNGGGGRDTQQQWQWQHRKSNQWNTTENCTTWDWMACVSRRNLQEKQVVPHQSDTQKNKFECTHFTAQLFVAKIFQQQWKSRGSVPLTTTIITTTTATSTHFGRSAKWQQRGLKIYKMPSLFHAMLNVNSSVSTPPWTRKHIRQFTIHNWCLCNNPHSWSHKVIGTEPATFQCKA